MEVCDISNVSAQGSLKYTIIFPEILFQILWTLLIIDPLMPF